jgi:hypothetical protein
MHNLRTHLAVVPRDPLNIEIQVPESKYFGCPEIGTDTDRTEKTVPLLLHRISVAKTRSFGKPLRSNGCCIFAYIAVVAQQRVYMPQYIKPGTVE